MSDVVRRGLLFPVAEMSDGSVSAAVPSIINEPYEAFMRMLKSDTFNPADALTVAGSAMAGNAFAKALPRAWSASPELQNASKNVSLSDPPRMPQRPFDADYPNGAQADASGRLTHDIDGQPIAGSAFIAGRSGGGLPDRPLGAQDVAAVGARLVGKDYQVVPQGSFRRGEVGRFKVGAGDNGPLYGIAVSNRLPPSAVPRVVAHEVGHGIDYFAGGRAGIPVDGLLKSELKPLYNLLNNPNRARDGSGVADWSKPHYPEHFGYKGDDIAPEYVAEAIRAYMSDPNSMKTLAPQMAKRIREYVNSNPRLNQHIHLNSIAGVGSLAGAGAASNAFMTEEPQQ